MLVTTFVCGSQKFLPRRSATRINKGVELCGIQISLGIQSSGATNPDDGLRLILTSWLGYSQRDGWRDTGWFKHASQTILVIGLNKSRVAPVFAVPRQFNRKGFGSKRFSSLWMGRRPMHNSSIATMDFGPPPDDVGRQRGVRFGLPVRSQNFLRQDESLMKSKVDFHLICS